MKLKFMRLVTGLIVMSLPLAGYTANDPKAVAGNEASAKATTTLPESGKLTDAKDGIAKDAAKDKVKAKAEHSKKKYHKLKHQLKKRYHYSKRMLKHGYKHHKYMLKANYRAEKQRIANLPKEQRAQAMHDLKQKYFMQKHALKKHYHMAKHHMKKVYHAKKHALKTAHHRLYKFHKKSATNKIKNTEDSSNLTNKVAK